MKNVLIFTILGGFFSLVLFYILKEFSPFEISRIDDLITANSLLPGEWDKLNILIQEQISKGLIFQYLSNSAYLAFVVALAGIFSFLTSIHLFFDKLFFRSFHESPSLYNAIRRSLLIVLTIGLVVYMKLSLLETQIILLVPVAAIIIEVIITSTINPFTKARLVRQKANSTPPDNSKSSQIKSNLEPATSEGENLENPDKLDS